MTRARLTFLLSAAALALAPAPARAQWSTVYEQFYMPADHNFVFRSDYPGADRLFNAFDYGHAILYETLWTHPGSAVQRLEDGEYTFLTTRLLNRPPRLPVVEEAIEPLYSRLAPEAKAMFEWAHILHRQVYDVLADERLDDAAKDRELRRSRRTISRGGTWRSARGPRPWRSCRSSPTRSRSARATRSSTA
jgi:hypothetical protein